MSDRLRASTGAPRNALWTGPDLPMSGKPLLRDAVRSGAHSRVRCFAEAELQVCARRVNPAAITLVSDAKPQAMDSGQSG